MNQFICMNDANFQLSCYKKWDDNPPQTLEDIQEIWHSIVKPFFVYANTSDKKTLNTQMEYTLKYASDAIDVLGAFSSIRYFLSVTIKNIMIEVSKKIRFAKQNSTPSVKKKISLRDIDDIKAVKDAILYKSNLSFSEIGTAFSIYRRLNGNIKNTYARALSLDFLGRHKEAVFEIVVSPLVAVLLFDRILLIFNEKAGEFWKLYLANLICMICYKMIEKTMLVVHLNFIEHKLKSKD